MATIRASIGAVPISEVCLFGILDNIKKIQTPKKKIEVHSRYRDDGFIVMKVTGSEIMQFFELANL